ncbi:fructose PTS transporter subunit IIA [Anaerococcus sp. AGMB09787]|uniref:PTS sugar transporter subunit IIA n=1 Tax=Anaerococcus sp. AGMB09787 TaxID=2922869 RepID=UPI001FB00756|nr:fructose PTS transporter subunit IIA [Anaerococcus sp. AGMB09787]
MDLRDVLKEELILLNLNSKNKEEALEEMANTLYDNNYIKDSKDFLEDVYKRESLGETGIGNYIAIPHGQSNSVVKTTLCISKLNNTIEWESLDGNGVKMIIMFVVENNNEFAGNHLKLLSEVAKKLANEETLKKLLSSKTKKDIIECFI